MRKTFFIALNVLFCLICVAAKSQVCTKWGPYIRSVFSNKVDADLMMADVMIPQEGNTVYTYTCAVQFNIGKSGGYCGLQNTNGDTGMQHPLNNIFSIWDFPNKMQIHASYKDPLTFVAGFGGEGTGLHSHCDFGWVPGRWYTNVVRRWYTGGDKTMVGYFIYDHTQQRWHHYVTFEVPEADAKLHGNIASFLENFADEKKRVRTSYYKSYWQLSVDNKWMKADTLLADAGEGVWDAKAYGNDGVQLIACGPVPIKKEKVFFMMNNKKDTPAIIKPAEIYDVGAYYDKAEKKIYANWSLKNNAAPQLSYTAALYNNPACTGNAIAVTHGTGPDIRTAMLQTNKLDTEKRTYYLLLTVKDIFNHSSAPKTFALEDLKP